MKLTNEQLEYIIEIFESDDDISVMASELLSLRNTALHNADDLRAKDRVLEELRKVDAWISMKDRTPELGQRCLTKMKHGIIEGEFICEDNELGFRGYYWRDLAWYASHWKPLTPPEDE